MIDNLQKAVSEQFLKVNCSNADLLKQEMDNFLIMNNGKFEAARNNNDDIVLAAAAMLFFIGKL